MKPLARPRPPRWIALACAAIVAALASGCALEIAPRIPRPELTRSVVLPVAETIAIGDEAACSRACAAPRPNEVLTSCHPAGMDVAILEHRAALGVPRSEVWIVCTYDATTSR